MGFSSRKLIAQLLALALVVMPFSTSFGGTVPWNPFAMDSVHANDNHCPGGSHNDSCSQETASHDLADNSDHCCGDHCDAFSTVQITTPQALYLDLPEGKRYQPAIAEKATPQIPDNLLRPPLTIS